MLLHKHIWFEEGDRRCCRVCGRIGVLFDPLKNINPNVSNEEAETIRNKAGYNKTLHDSTQQRIAWLIVSIFALLAVIYQLIIKKGVSIGILLGLLISICCFAYYGGKISKIKRT